MSSWSLRLLRRDRLAGVSRYPRGSWERARAVCWSGPNSGFGWSPIRTRPSTGRSYRFCTANDGGSAAISGTTGQFCQAMAHGAYRRAAEAQMRETA
jgi:hypothetical protein